MTIGRNSWWVSAKSDTISQLPGESDKAGHHGTVDLLVRKLKVLSLVLPNSHLVANIALAFS